MKLVMENIEFVESTHTYYYTGDGGRTKLPSVTSITKYLSDADTLMNWSQSVIINYLKDNIDRNKTYDGYDILELIEQASNRTDEISERAIEIGNKFHSTVEDYILAKVNDDSEPDLIHEDDQVQIALNSFNSWVQRNDVQFLDSEFVVYHPKNRYVGTADILAKVNGSLYIIDLKTSSNIYKKYKLQASAYTCAYNKLNEQKADGYGILNFPKEEGDRLDPFFRDDPHELWNDFESFLGLLDVYEWEQQN